MLTVDSPVGAGYLDATTKLLQRRRLAEPDREVWEAADLQWWWTRNRHDDPDDARVWSDDVGPVAAVVFTRWNSDHVGCDVFAAADFQPAWSFAAEGCVRQAVPRIEMALPAEDDGSHATARRAGFAPTEGTYAVSWLDPGERREPRRPLPEGYRIVSRYDDQLRPHPMIPRNGPQIEEGLGQCSLYDPRLDLSVLAPDHSVAGYALFWSDLVTGVGLVEPMRIEADHAGQGLATHLLDAGLRGLTASGCTRLKVSFEPENTPAARLYTGAGFVVSRLDRTWVYERPAAR